MIDVLTDRQIGRQTYRRTGRQTDRHTGRQTDRRSGRQTDRQTDRPISHTHHQLCTYSFRNKYTLYGYIVRSTCCAYFGYTNTHTNKHVKDALEMAIYISSGIYKFNKNTHTHTRADMHMYIIRYTCTQTLEIAICTSSGVYRVNQIHIHIIK